MSEWVESPLIDLANIVSGGTPSRDVPAYWGGEIPWVTPTDITACRTNYLEQTQDSISKQGLLSSSTKLLPAGAILLTSRASIGLAKIARVPVSTNQGFKSLIPKQVIDGTFLFYQIQRLRGSFERFAAGSTFLEINKKDTERISLPHPIDPIEQKKIATILTGIDTAIEKTEALIAKYQQIKAGLMHDLFTRGVLPNGQLRPPREQAPELYQETAIGWIPREWRVSKLEDVCKSIVDCPHSTPNFQPSGVLVARTMHIKNGVFLEHEASFVSEQEYQERIARAEPLAGDVVFTREAPVGEAFVIPKGMRICLGQRVMLIKPNSAILESDYLVAQIYGGSLSTRIAELTAGTTNPHLNVADVRTLLMALPPFQEQVELKIRVNAMNAQLHSQERTLRKLQQQKSGLMHDLLTGKVSVKVVEPEVVDG